MYQDPSKLWWDNITGPQNLIGSIVESLRDGTSVILLVPDDLPWRKAMRDSVEESLRSSAPNLVISQIDCETDCEPDDNGSIDVARFLLECYAEPEVACGYRQASGLSIQKYIASKRVLNNRVLWVKGMGPSQVRDWVGFCAKYHPDHDTDGLFVIEAYADEIKNIPMGTFDVVRYDDFITQYDALLFNNMAVSGLSRNTAQVQYVAALASSLCNKDVELSSDLISGYDLICTSAEKALIDLSEDSYYHARYEAENLPKGHPFSLIKQGELKELENHVWKAQLQRILPLIEEERMSLINTRKDDIEEALDTAYTSANGTSKTGIYEYGERVTDPYDVEFGTLCYMMSLYRADNTEQFLVSFRVPADRDRIWLLRDMRNKIAHMDICSTDEITAFFEQYPHEWGQR